MARLSKAEFLEKYGDTVVTFNNYYKFIFTFTGITEEGYDISVGYGGDSGDIYRTMICNNETGTVRSIDPDLYIGRVFMSWVDDADDIDSFYE